MALFYLISATLNLSKNYTIQIATQRSDLSPTALHLTEITHYKLQWLSLI